MTLWEYECLGCREFFHLRPPDDCENCGCTRFRAVRVRDVGRR